MKRFLDPIVDPNKLNHAQLVTLVEKQQVEISAQQQELNNYERSKKANKEAANQWLKENNDLKAANSEQHVLMSALRDTNLQQTTDLQQHQRLTADQEKLIMQRAINRAYCSKGEGADTEAIAARGECSGGHSARFI